MRKTTKVAAVALAAALGTAMFAGCDLISTNLERDYEQVIAEVNISQSEDFAEGGKYAAYKDAVSTTEITKLEMVAYFVSTGYSIMQQQGLTYYDTFALISDTLVNRAIYVQHSMVYLLANGNADGGTYTMEKLNAAIDAAETEEDKALAAVAYFLDEDEIKLAQYRTRVMFNNTIDTQEESIIDAQSDTSSSETARTTPTGVDTESDTYYDESYKVYTGSNAAANCGSYETVEGSTPTTRQRAYSAFLANLRSNNLVSAGDDVTDIESLSYYKLELRSAYEDQLISKLADKYEQEALADFTEDQVKTEYDTALSRQTTAFADESTFETALDGMADDSFVLTAPEAGYGFVVNILIPFTTTQTNDLTNYHNDYDSATETWRSNKFAYRAELLQSLRGTDQRGTWITGATDYSFDASKTEGAYKGTGDNQDARNLLFFEDGISDNSRYERIPNYFGMYTYNGTYNEDKNVATPARIDIDRFIAEMEDYLNSKAAQDAVTKDGDTTYSASGSYVNGEDGTLTPIDAANKDEYYSRPASDYYNADNTVDYSKFIYYAGSVNFDGGFNANEMFLAGSAENVVYSAINELSFAYNTDTAGLNTYLGYSVITGNTDYVDEFEYAAQYVCRLGAGNYVVVATDYGWHIIYCTFSFTEGNLTPFSYDDAQKDVEGTFSNLFYEALRTDIVDQYTNVQRTKAINAYTSCATVYEDRYADLSGLDSET
ncbi:MAG TPA: hypothetical protein H9663_04810 [Firmicutes bacterium]|nr:hypothetical protein [Bacillota bacterium]